MPIGEADFKRAMSQFVSGVTVVTTANGGQLYGMTVASFASLSLDPPLVLICVGRRMQTHDAIASAGRFGVSILGTDQQPLSNHFASKIEDKFAGVDYRVTASGVPLLNGAICTLECTLAEQLPGGDHSIFVGRVEAAETAENAPLVYFRSGYRELA
jgi:3-hydroxy-9,10-secoandrosta-1,3,5(10)-triene-9,17-dione monooxygenase reductase component